MHDTHLNIDSYLPFKAKKKKKKWNTERSRFNCQQNLFVLEGKQKSHFHRATGKSARQHSKDKSSWKVQFFFFDVESIQEKQ